MIKGPGPVIFYYVNQRAKQDRTLKQHSFFYVFQSISLYVIIITELNKQVIGPFAHAKG